MRMTDFTPFFRSTIGFDRMLDALENAQVEQFDSFPPYDIEKLGEDRYRITLAVAGFHEDELDVVAQSNVLIVSGRKRDEGEGTYLHRGIAARSFERRFDLADFVEVGEARLSDGLLLIDLVREVPEEMKPRRIEIQSDPEATRIGKKAA
jgi:molecular chaperone IbpA